MSYSHSESNTPVVKVDLPYTNNTRLGVDSGMSEDTLDAFVWFLGAVRTVPDWYGCPEALMYLSRRDGSQAHVRMLFRGIDFHGICLDKGDAQEGVFINRTELPDFVTRKLIYIFSDPQDNSLEIRMLVN